MAEQGNRSETLLRTAPSRASVVPLYLSLSPELGDFLALSAVVEEAQYLGSKLIDQLCLDVI